MNRDRFRYYDLLVHTFVVILLISNLVGQKITAVGPFRFSGAMLFFPITYIFGDVFTEDIRDRKKRISSAMSSPKFMDMALRGAPSGSDSSRRHCWRPWE